MTAAKSDLLQGTLDLLILQVVAPGPLHGYAIAQRLQQLSKEALQVQQGSLYPALHRLEQAGMIKSRWAAVAGRRRRVYELTRRGAKAFAKHESEWRRFVHTLDAILGGAA